MPSSALSLKHKNLPQDQNVGGPGAEINLREKPYRSEDFHSFPQFLLGKYQDSTSNRPLPLNFYILSN
jgi:hypothetical protein